MKEDMLVIRKVNKGIYLKFRQRALKRNMNVGTAVTEAMKIWLKADEQRGIINPKALLRLNGIIKVDKKVRWSEEIDKTLYGGFS
jgi:hypothetical protein